MTLHGPTAILGGNGHQRRREKDGPGNATAPDAARWRDERGDHNAVTHAAVARGNQLPTEIYGLIKGVNCLVRHSAVLDESLGGAPSRGSQRRFHHDFGKDILPSMVGTHRVIAYRFGGTSGRVTADRYWRDVGTLDAYYEANMDLLQPVPAMDLYQGDWPIRTYEGQHPPARSVPGRSGREAEIVNCMLASGTLIVGGTLRHAILFPNVRVEEGAVVENSLLFQGVTVGEGAQLQRCIVDKHVVIPPGERIGFDRARDAERFTVSDCGIVVIAKGYRFAAGAGVR